MDSTIFEVSSATHLEEETPLIQPPPTPNPFLFTADIPRPGGGGGLLAFLSGHGAALFAQAWASLSPPAPVRQEAESRKKWGGVFLMSCLYFLLASINAIVNCYNICISVFVFSFTFYVGNIKY